MWLLPHPCQGLVRGWTVKMGNFYQTTFPPTQLKILDMVRSSSIHSWAIQFTAVMHATVWPSTAFRFWRTIINLDICYAGTLNSVQRALIKSHGSEEIELATRPCSGLPFIHIFVAHAYSMDERIPMSLRDLRSKAEFEDVWQQQRFFVYFTAHILGFGRV